MSFVIVAHYASAADLARHLADHSAQGALLLPLREPPAELQQFQRLTLRLVHPEEEGDAPAEVLQLIPGLGLVVKLLDVESAAAVAGDAAPSTTATPPVVELLRESAEESAELAGDPPPEESEELEEHGPARGTSPAGMGPLAWPFERLQAEWPTLPIAAKMRVAKYGKRPARGMIMRMIDPTLHNVLLSNPQLTAEEVAILAGTASLDSGVLKRIAGSVEWIRHSAVARNLTCHPKTSLPQIMKLLEHLPDNDLRQLARTGKVRAAVKRLIMKKLEVRNARNR